MNGLVDYLNLSKCYYVCEIYVWSGAHSYFCLDGVGERVIKRPKVGVEDFFFEDYCIVASEHEFLWACFAKELVVFVADGLPCMRDERA